MPSFISNFEFLKHHDELLFRLAETAERCYASDLNDEPARELLARIQAEQGSVKKPKIKRSNS